MTSLPAQVACKQLASLLISCLILKLILEYARAKVHGHIHRACNLLFNCSDESLHLSNLGCFGCAGYAGHALRNAFASHASTPAAGQATGQSQPILLYKGRGMQLFRLLVRFKVLQLLGVAALAIPINTMFSEVRICIISIPQNPEDLAPSGMTDAW